MSGLMPSIDVVRFLHNLFTALWIGGLLMMTVVVLPGIRMNALVEEPWPIIESIQKRIRPVAFVSIPGLAVTGILLGRSSEDFVGLMDFSTPYMNAMSIKHIVILLMIALAIVRLNLNKRIQKQGIKKLQKASFGVLMVNAVLGVAVLFLSSIV